MSYPLGSHPPPGQGGGNYPPPAGGQYPPPAGGQYPPAAGGYGGGYPPPGGNYPPPPGGYGTPQGGYGPPQGGYGLPPQGYGPSPGGPYGVPPQGYGPPPVGNYGTGPTQGYGGPHGAGPPVYNPPLPFDSPIHGGVHPGKCIVIKGVLTGQNGFAVNFCCGDDIGFHFNPRPHQNCVVRNSKQHGNWAHEERHGGFPFAVGHPFELCIMIEPHEYKVLVNGQPFSDFNIRLHPMEQYCQLNINGDLQLQEVRM